MTNHKSKIWAIIPASGSGLRMGTSKPKQYLKIANKTVVQYSLETLAQSKHIDGIVVGIKSNDQYWKGLNFSHEKLLGTYTGGTERANTVLNGINYLKDFATDNDWVLVHDAVRPCIDKDDINNLIIKALKSPSGAVLCTRITDTVKSTNDEDKIINTIDRRRHLLAVTPQMFPIRLLEQALNQIRSKDSIFTDDSSAVESLGSEPLAVIGRSDNLKITSKEDLLVAEKIIGLKS